MDTVMPQLVRLLVVDDSGVRVKAIFDSIRGTIHRAFGQDPVSKSYPGGPLVELAIWTFDKSDTRFKAQWIPPPEDRRDNPEAFDKWNIEPWADEAARVLIEDYDPTFLLLDIDLSSFAPRASEGSGIGAVAQAAGQDTAEGAFIAQRLAARKVAGTAGRLQVVWMYSGFGPAVVLPARNALPMLQKAGFEASLRFALTMSGREISQHLRRRFEAARFEIVSGNRELRDGLSAAVSSARRNDSLDPQFPLGPTIVRNGGSARVKLAHVVPEVLNEELSEATKIAVIEKLLGIDLSESCSVAYNCFGVRVLTHRVGDWRSALDRIGVRFEDQDDRGRIVSAVTEAERLGALFNVLGQRERAHIEEVWRDADDQFVPNGIQALLEELRLDPSSLVEGVSTKLNEYRAHYCKLPHHVPEILWAMKALGFASSARTRERRCEELTSVPADDLFYLYWPFLCRASGGRPGGCFVESIRNFGIWAQRLGFRGFCDFVSLPDARGLDPREKEWHDTRSPASFVWYDDQTFLATSVHCFCLGLLPVDEGQRKFELQRFDLTPFTEVGGALSHDFGDLMNLFGRMLVLARDGRKRLDAEGNFSPVGEETEDDRIATALAARFEDVFEASGGLVCFCFKTCTQLRQA